MAGRAGPGQEGRGGRGQMSEGAKEAGGGAGGSAAAGGAGQRSRAGLEECNSTMQMVLDWAEQSRQYLLSQPQKSKLHGKLTVIAAKTTVMKSEKLLMPPVVSITVCGQTSPFTFETLLAVEVAHAL